VSEANWKIELEPVSEANWKIELEPVSEANWKRELEPVSEANWKIELEPVTSAAALPASSNRRTAASPHSNWPSAPMTPLPG
jgi:hypothetical protein